MKIAMYAGLALLVVGCQREQTAPPTATTQTATQTTTVAVPADMTEKKVDEVIVPAQHEFVMSSRAGTAVDKDGMVSKDQNTLKRGQPLRLSMWLKESPSGLHTSAVVFDEKDEKVTEDRKPMNGAKTVTFTFDSKKLKPGKYRVVGYWGGNIAAEYVVTVTK